MCKTGVQQDESGLVQVGTLSPAGTDMHLHLSPLGPVVQCPEPGTTVGGCFLWLWGEKSDCMAGCAGRETG